MFERRQRAVAGLSFNHVQRRLQHGEQIPALPCLSDQIMACRHELARTRREAARPVDGDVIYLDVAGEVDDDED